MYYLDTRNMERSLISETVKEWAYGTISESQSTDGN